MRRIRELLRQLPHLSLCVVPHLGVTLTLLPFTSSRIAPPRVDRDRAESTERPARTSPPRPCARPPCAALMRPRAPCRRSCRRRPRDRRLGTGSSRRRRHGRSSASPRAVSPAWRDAPRTPGRRSTGARQRTELRSRAAAPDGARARGSGRRQVGHRRALDIRTGDRLDHEVGRDGRRAPHAALLPPADQRSRRGRRRPLPSPRRTRAGAGAFAAARPARPSARRSARRAAADPPAAPPRTPRTAGPRAPADNAALREEQIEHAPVAPGRRQTGSLCQLCAEKIRVGLARAAPAIRCRTSAGQRHV